MSKQWYYEVMGTIVGPVPPAELKQKVLKGQIQPDTMVRCGTDGKWTPADHVKGLMDEPGKAPGTGTVSDLKAAATRDTHLSQPVPAREPSVVPSAAKPNPGRSQPAPSAQPPVHAEGKLYHVEGDPSGDDAADDEEPHEFDFFRFVGFEQAIGPALHQVLDAHCRKHHLTLSEATRIALATYLNRKDLLPQPAAPSAAPAEVSAV